MSPSRVGWQIRSEQFLDGAWGEIIATDTTREGEATYLISWPDESTTVWPVADLTGSYEFRVKEGAS